MLPTSSPRGFMKCASLHRAWVKEIHRLPVISPVFPETSAASSLCFLPLWLRGLGNENLICSVLNFFLWGLYKEGTLSSQKRGKQSSHPHQSLFWTKWKLWGYLFGVLVPFPLALPKTRATISRLGSPLTLDSTVPPTLQLGGLCPVTCPFQG